ncbi:MAG TPA: cell envelope biogenesis protein TolA [Myxococcaceae bacterium]|nr:cell envelope biogenesis protein TolA [Myxococcaceae bacterium]
MITVVLVLVSIALCVTLGILLFGSRRGLPPPTKVREQMEAEVQSRSALQLDLEKRKKELEDSKHQLNEAREQLKQAKKKLFEQKESERDSRHLARERDEIERSASVQLERVRLELSHAQVEIQKLKTDLEGTRSRRTAPAAPVSAPAPQPAPAPVVAAATVSSPPVPDKSVRKFRELTDADKERMQRLEQQAARERTRAGEFERELKRFRARSETQHRVYVVTKGELDLVKDKFKALEKRLNRILLERDLVGRALRDLERRSGIAAERTELTAEEIAASDRTVDEKAAIAAAEAERVNAAAKAQAEREEREREKAATQESHSATEGSANHAQDASADHSEDASANHPVGNAS